MARTPRRHVSFASKFCHFFIDGQDFPILDQAARDALRLHLGRDGFLGAELGYSGFCGALGRLKTGLLTGGKSPGLSIAICGLRECTLSSPAAGGTSTAICSRYLILSRARLILDALLISLADQSGTRA